MRFFSITPSLSSIVWLRLEMANFNIYERKVKTQYAVDSGIYFPHILYQRLN